jgi:hypothetical protein
VSPPLRSSLISANNLWAGPHIAKVRAAPTTISSMPDRGPSEECCCSASLLWSCRSFTFFEAFSINFAIVVYFECLHVKTTCINPTLGITHGQESEEGEGKEDSQEEKEVTVRRNLRGIWIASDSYAPFLHRKGLLPPTDYPRNSQVGPLCRWLLHNGPGFHCAIGI